MASVDNVYDIAPINKYVASSGQTVFDYDFPIFDAVDLRVYVGEVLQSIGTDYTVQGEGNENGGTVTFAVGRVAGTQITIYRKMPIERLTDMAQNGPMRAADFNQELDRITMYLQEIERDMARSLRFGLLGNSPSPELSPIDNWKDRYLYVNSSGALQPAVSIDPTVLTPSLIGEMLYPVTSQETGAGVVPLDQTYKPGDIRRYGAVDGLDCTAAINDSIAQMQQDGGADVYIPTGTWLSSGQHVVDYVGWRIVGDDCVRSIIRFTSSSGSSGGMLIAGLYGTMRGVGFYNGGDVDHGVIIYNAGGSSFYNVFVGGMNVGFESHGFLIDENYLSPKGNNNNIRFFNCSSQRNTGSGFAWSEPGLDQNAIELYACNGSYNSGHGLLLKSQANRVFGGIYEGNGGFGILIGEDGEVTSSRSVVFYPYLESNTSGGVGASNATLNNQIHIDGLNANSGYSASLGAENFVYQPNNSSGPMMFMGSPEAQLKVHSVITGTPRLGVSADGTGSNITMYLNGKGNGGTWLEADNDSTSAAVRIGAHGGALKNVLRGQVTFAGSNVVNVTFDSALDGSAYLVMIGTNHNDPIWWDSKTASGFVLRAPGNISATVDWMVIQ